MLNRSINMLTAWFCLQFDMLAVALAVKLEQSCLQENTQHAAKVSSRDRGPDAPFKEGARRIHKPQALTRL